eukprot:5771915-Prymnesium_polylepis.1
MEHVSSVYCRGREGLNERRYLPHCGLCLHLHAAGLAHNLKRRCQHPGTEGYPVVNIYYKRTGCRQVRSNRHRVVAVV